MNNPGSGIKKESYLDWLEKQNELKPVSFSCSHENGKPAEWSGQIEGGKEMTLAEYLKYKMKKIILISLFLLVLVLNR